MHRFDVRASEGLILAVSSFPCYQAITVKLATFREALNTVPIESGLILTLPAVAFVVQDIFNYHSRGLWGTGSS